MYLEIKDLTQEELALIKEKFSNRLRTIYSIYHETCRIEADCSIERVIDEHKITLDEKSTEEAIEAIALELANQCEDSAFQEMCERADEITRQYFSDK